MIKEDYDLILESFTSKGIEEDVSFKNQVCRDFYILLLDTH